MGEISQLEPELLQSFIGSVTNTKRPVICCKMMKLLKSSPVKRVVANNFGGYLSYEGASTIKCEEYSLS